MIHHWQQQVLDCVARMIREGDLSTADRREVVAKLLDAVGEDCRREVLADLLAVERESLLIDRDAGPIDGNLVP